MGNVNHIYNNDGVDFSVKLSIKGVIVKKRDVERILTRRMETVLIDHITDRIRSNVRVEVEEVFLLHYLKKIEKLYPDHKPEDVVYGTEMKMDKKLRKEVNDAIKLIPTSITIYKKGNELCKSKLR